MAEKLKIKEKILREMWNRAINHPNVTDKWINRNILNPDRQDSVWYEDDVLSIVYMNRFALHVRALGIVDMRWADGLDSGEDECDRASPFEREIWLAEHGIHNDAELSSAMDDKLYFYDNNWFALEIYDEQEERFLTDDWDPWAPDPVVDINSEEMMEVIREYVMQLVEDEKLGSISTIDTSETLIL